MDVFRLIFRVQGVYMGVFGAQKSIGMGENIKIISFLSSEIVFSLALALLVLEIFKVKVAARQEPPFNKKEYDCLIDYAIKCNYANTKNKT